MVYWLNLNLNSGKIVWVAKISNSQDGESNIPGLHEVWLAWPANAGN